MGRPKTTHAGIPGQVDKLTSGHFWAVTKGSKSDLGRGGVGQTAQRPRRDLPDVAIPEMTTTVQCELGGKAPEK
jgi:hypothetical protein